MMPDGPIAFYMGYNRIEVIDHTGRAYTYWHEDSTGIELNQQDEGRTLKIFIGGEKKDPPA